MTQPKILAFAGSTRRQSFNKRLVNLAAKLVRDAGGQVTLIDLKDYPLPLFDQDLEQEQGRPENMKRLKQLFLEHDGLLLASPEYNSSITPLLKNTIDWASSPAKGHPDWQDGTKSFRGKVVGMLSASPGALGGLRSQSHLAPLLINLECWLAPKAFALGSAGSAFDEHGALVQQTHRDRVRAVVDQVLWASARLHGTVATA